MLKRISLIVISLQLYFAGFSFTQNQNTSSEEEAIKSVIMNETKSWADENYEGMAETWAHEEYVLKMLPGPESYEEIIGWDSIDADIKTFMKQYDLSINVAWSDWDIHPFNDCAWVSYIQTMTLSDPDEGPYQSREIRFLEKKNGLWKIVFHTTVMKSYYKIYQDYNASIENNINEVGYKLLEEKKFEDAIDLFKKNVKLHPKSSNVYDSLGEAYMKNGDKELAIKNYKMSLELDPQNNNAKEMIKTLKEK
jgi:tetratricopeptide (TPR) repeat protein